jgi:RNA polymerase primary sigma factor
MRELKLNKSITRRDNDSINRYLGEIGRIPLLAVADEIMLSRRIKEGDLTAKDYLVRTNLRFVVSVAKNYQHRGLSLGDLINEGNIGLIRAAAKFDDTRGFKFISFAVWWIRQAILDALAEQTRVIRLPHNVVNSVTRLNKLAAELEQQLERAPTDEEIAAAAEQNLQKISEQLKNARKCKSLDAVWNTDVGSTLLDVLVSEDEGRGHTLANEIDDERLRELLMRISARERKVLVLYYGLFGAEPRPLADIALSMKLSKERTRQLKDQGIKKIRLYLKRKSNNKKTNI